MGALAPLRLTGVSDSNMTPPTTSADTESASPFGQRVMISFAETMNYSGDARFLITRHALMWRAIQHGGAIHKRSPVVPVHDELLERPILASMKPRWISELAVQSGHRQPATFPDS